MKKILLLLFISTSLFSYSQKWCSPGSKWHYGPFNSADDITVGYIIITYTGDTVINSVTCNKLLRADSEYSFITKSYFSSPLGESYTYAGPNVVYIYGHNNAFDTLYDFGATPGEKWTAYGPIYYGNKCDSTGIIKVDSIGTMVINSHTLRYICVSVLDTEQHWGFNSKIVEQVGPIQALSSNPYQYRWSYMLPEKFDYCGMQLDAVQEDADFRCYSDSSGFFYGGDTGTVACDYIPTSVLSLTNLSFISVSPNPSNGIFKIESSVAGNQWSVEIYNVLGEKIYMQTLRQIQGDNLIDISSQPAGIYLYKVLSDKGEYIASGKLVIE